MTALRDASTKSEEKLKDIPLGVSATVRVPASSANLGPGFDALGLALGIDDEISGEITQSGLLIEVEGEGASDVPRDETHLVYQALDAALTLLGYQSPGKKGEERGLALRCQNRIPQARGLGSSASAVVGGIALAYSLVGIPYDYPRMIQLAGEFEGHPDNSSASILGGFIISWSDLPGEPTAQYEAVQLDVHPSVCVTVLIPSCISETKETRGILSATVPRSAAVFNASRSALLTAALTQYPDLLFAATEDRLHQAQRAVALPLTTQWVQKLRSRGFAAVVSGAGPTVLCFHTDPLPSDLLLSAEDIGLRVLNPSIAMGVGSL